MIFYIHIFQLKNRKLTFFKIFLIHFTFLKMGLCSITLLHGIVISLGPMLMGFIAAYTSPTGKDIRDRHHLSDSDFRFSFYCSIAFLSAALGPFVTKFLLNIFKGKRKNTMFVMSVFTTAAWLLNCLTKINIYAGWVTRFLLGLSLGMYSSISAMYLIEIAPKEYAGFYGSLNTISAFIGQSIISFLRPFIDYMGYNYLCAAVALFLSISICFIRESPLITSSPLIQETEKEKVSIFQMKYLKGLIIGIIIMFIQQFSGVNGILANLADIFRQAGLNFNPNYQSGLSILFLLASNFACSVMIDKLGSRFQFILSCSVSFFGTFIMGLNDKYKWSNILPLICIFTYNIGFGLGLSSIPWLMVLDLFDDQVRETGNTICVVSNWCMAFLIVMVFPMMVSSIGMFGSMLLFAAVCAAGVLFGVFLMPKHDIRKVEDIETSGDEEDDLYE